MSDHLSCSLAGIPLEHPVMNAAGTVRTVEDVERIAPSNASAIVVGSITVEPRDGNGGNVFWPDEGFALNSMGLPNRGLPYYKEHLPHMAEIAHAAKKPLIVSAAGSNPQEYADLSEVAFASGADLVELNLGCPNVWNDGEQKIIPSFDPALMDAIFRKIEENMEKNWRMIVKLSPFSNRRDLEQAAAVINRYNFLKGAVSCNTFPNALAYQPNGHTATDPAEGLAGLSGDAMRPIALGQVKQLRNHLLPRVDIVGVGGVSTGRHMAEYCWGAGAVAVQVGTAYIKHKERIFTQILEHIPAPGDGFSE